MTALASSYSPTVRAEAEEPWSTSTSLSFQTYRALLSPKVTVSLADRHDQVERETMEAASELLSALIALPEGWDGANARRISPVSAIRSLHLIAFLVTDCVPLPHTFPLPYGGIQLEWLVAGSGLEIEVSPDGEINALGVDADGLTQIDEALGAGAGGDSIVRTKHYLRSISKALHV